MYWFFGKVFSHRLIKQFQSVGFNVIKSLDRAIIWSEFLVNTKCILCSWFLYCIYYVFFQKFYRYYDHIYNKNLRQKKRQQVVAMPYLLIFKQCFPQCLNIFIIYFTTLVIYPAVLAGIVYTYFIASFTTTFTKLMNNVRQ